jgi:hypothetical protein
VKRDTTEKLKFKRLIKALGVPSYQGAGILESLWHLTAKNTPDGGIGRHTNQEIAEAIGWEKDGDALINILVDQKWIDPNDKFRLVVHDWPDHCEDSIHASLARKIQHMADGSRPKISKLPASERPEVTSAFEALERAQKGSTALLSDSKAPALALALALASANALAIAKPEEKNTLRVCDADAPRPDALPDAPIASPQPEPGDAISPSSLPGPLPAASGPSTSPEVPLRPPKRDRPPPSQTTKERPRDPIWDAVCSLFSLDPKTRDEHSRVGKIVRDLKAKNATPEESARRLANHKANWPNIALVTPESLVKHWDQHDREHKSNVNRNTARLVAPSGKYDHIGEAVGDGSGT